MKLHFLAAIFALLSTSSVFAVGAQSALALECQRLADSSIAEFNSIDHLNATESELKSAHLNAINNSFKLSDLMNQAKEEKEYKTCMKAYHQHSNITNGLSPVMNSSDCTSLAQRADALAQVSMNDKNYLKAAEVYARAMQKLLVTGVYPNQDNESERRICQNSHQALYNKIRKIPGGVEDYIRQHMPEYADRLDP